MTFLATINTKACKYCNESIFDSRHPKRIFCSRKCYAKFLTGRKLDKSTVDKVIATKVRKGLFHNWTEEKCKVCGIIFRVHPYKKKRNEGKHCSSACSFKGRIGIVFSEEHKKHLSEAFRKKFSTNENHPRWIKERHVCVDCKKELSSRKNKRCRPCNNKFSVGVHSHNWRGGRVSEKIKIRKSKEYRLWREAVFKRDDWTCLECGNRGCKLNAHHIKPFWSHPELGLVLDNGVTLCLDCHKKTDSYLINPKKI